MKVRILDGDIHLIDLKTRMPFKYGIATMTEAPHAFVRMRVVVDDVEEMGVSADLLPPKWFTKDPAKPLDQEIDEMLLVIEHAVKTAAGMKADSAFDLWRQLWDEQDRWGREQKLPPLLTHFGTSLVERALIEANCRREDETFAELLLMNAFGIRLESLHDCLKGLEPGDLLREVDSVAVVRHTVGLADPLHDEDILEGERLDDGLPQSLAACLETYGLKHLKIKVSGDLARDRTRIRDAVTLLEKHARRDPARGFSLDGNEQFQSLDAFRDYWRQLMTDADLKRFWKRLLFVEQPFHRGVALDAEAMAGLNRWPDRPRLIIDESDAELDSVSRALALGYLGTSHKNCKGVFRSIANACLLKVEERARRLKLTLSGEDLANIGPVALLQDLVVANRLGVESIERNGHHYFAGLSHFPAAVQDQVLDCHGDLYEPSRDGWPTLGIEDGTIELGSVVMAPFGVEPRIDVELFTPLKQWRRTHRKGAPE